MDRETLGIASVIFLAFLLSAFAHVVSFTLPNAMFADHGGQRQEAPLRDDDRH